MSSTAYAALTAALVVIGTGSLTGAWTTYRATAQADDEPAEDRSPEYCHRHHKRCGQQH